MDAREGVVPPLDPGRSLPLPRGAGSPAASQDKLFLIKGAESLPPLPSLACMGQGRAAAAAVGAAEAGAREEGVSIPPPLP